jgi:hypothetical protein
MRVLDKLAALSELCGPEIQPLAVNRRSYLLGLIPFNRFDSYLWVADQGDWWRVMVSSHRTSASQRPIIGADFRKSDGATRVNGGFIPWAWENRDWTLAWQEDACEIRQRVEQTVELAYSQFQAIRTPRGMYFFRGSN